MVVKILGEYMAETKKRDYKKLIKQEFPRCRFNVNQIKRILKYIDKPTYDNWDDIAFIICKKYTIWQLVRASNQSFPKQGRVYNMRQEVVKEWTEIPTAKDIYKALFYSNH